MSDHHCVQCYRELKSYSSTNHSTKFMCLTNIFTEGAWVCIVFLELQPFHSMVSNGSNSNSNAHPWDQVSSFVSYLQIRAGNYRITQQHVSLLQAAFVTPALPWFLSASGCQMRLSAWEVTREHLHPWVQLWAVGGPSQWHPPTCLRWLWDVPCAWDVILGRPQWWHHPSQSFVVDQQ